MRDEKDEGPPLATQALGISGDNVPLLFEAGMVFEDLGDRDKALELIERAIRGGYSIADVELYPGLRDLRADPRFVALRAELAAGTAAQTEEGAHERRERGPSDIQIYKQAGGYPSARHLPSRPGHGGHVVSNARPRRGPLSFFPERDLCGAASRWSIRREPIRAIDLKTDLGPEHLSLPTPSM